MLNTLLMVIASLIFVAFWAYLAWDSYRDLKKPAPKPRRKRPV